MLILEYFKTDIPEFYQQSISRLKCLVIKAIIGLLYEYKDFFNQLCLKPGRSLFKSNQIVNHF